MAKLRGKLRVRPSPAKKVALAPKRREILELQVLRGRLPELAQTRRFIVKLEAAAAAEAAGLVVELLVEMALHRVTAQHQRDTEVKLLVERMLHCVVVQDLTLRGTEEEEDAPAPAPLPAPLPAAAAAATAAAAAAVAAASAAAAASNAAAAATR